MSNEEDQLPVTWSEVFKDIVAGGAPAILAGPAGKALSQLIGSVIDIPVAWFEGFASRIRDESKARSIVMEALAAKSAEVGVSDPSLLNRGLINLLGRAYREQENKEEIAKKTLERLVEEPPSPTSEGPSDDFMNLFGDYAAKATSEKLREMWADVLAGEIRKPCSFSLATLHFVSVLDREIAQATEAVLSHAVQGTLVLLETGDGEFYDKIGYAVSSGIIHSAIENTTLTKEAIPGQTLVPFLMNNVVILAHHDMPLVPPISVAGNSITRTGKEMQELLKPKASEKAISLLVDQLKRNQRVKKIERSDSYRLMGGRVNPADVRTIWER